MTKPQPRSPAQSTSQHLLSGSIDDAAYSKFDIAQEDTLELPQHEGMTFEAIVAPPPFLRKVVSQQGLRE